MKIIGNLQSQSIGNPEYQPYLSAEFAPLQHAANLMAAVERSSGDLSTCIARLSFHLDDVKRVISAEVSYCHFILVLVLISEC